MKNLKIARFVYEVEKRDELRLLFERDALLIPRIATERASVAQLVEQLICNQLVGSSSLSAGSISLPFSPFPLLSTW